MSFYSSDEDDDSDIGTFQFSFQFYLPAGAVEGGGAAVEGGGVVSATAGDEGNDRPPRGVQVIRFHAGIPSGVGGSSPSNNSTSLGMMRTSSGEGRGVRRGLRPLPQRQRQHQQQQAQDIMDHIQQNASLFAAIAIRQFLMDGGFPENPHLQGQPPASKTAVEALQTVDTLSEKRRLKHRICSICQDDFKPCSLVPPAASTNGTESAAIASSAQALDTTIKAPSPPKDDCDSIIRMPCHHIFHKECLTPWLIGRSATCPTCRYEIATENEDYNRGLRERMKERDDKLKNDPDTDMEDEDEHELLRSTDVTPVSAAPPSSSNEIVSPLLASAIPTDRLFDAPALSTNAISSSSSSVLRTRKRQRRVAAPDNTASATAASSSTAPSAIEIERGLRRSKRLRRD